jgi:peroxiredoxin
MSDKKGFRVSLKVVLVLIVLGAVVFFVHFSRIDKFKPVVPGSSAPDFSFKNLKGEQVRLSDYRGQVVLLNIWATWCHPCVEELPSMEKLYRELKDKGFTILAVSIDKNESPVKRFVEKLSLTFPVLLDPKNRITRLYRTTGVPETFIIDKKGVIREKIIGARNWFTQKTVEEFEQLLHEEGEKARQESTSGKAMAQKPSSLKKQKIYFKRAKVEKLDPKKAPDFTFPDMNNKKVSISNFKGKVVLLNFWATWCGPCIEEMPSLESLYHELKGDDFALLAVNLREKKKPVRQFLKKNKLTLPVLLDTHGQAMSSYGVWSIPATYIVDKKGYLVGRAIGQRDWNSKAVKGLIRSLY